MYYCNSQPIEAVQRIISTMNRFSKADTMKYYVDIQAHSNGDGSQERPFKHINDAALVAKAGDEVIVAPGLYREYVDPVNAGTEDAPIVYRSSAPLAAEITGAEEVKNWQHYDGDTWVARIDNGVFADYNPYIQMVEGDWYFGKIDKHTGEVWLNDEALYEVNTLDECVNPQVYPMSWQSEEKSLRKWYTVQDESANQTVIYANFGGVDPTRENVEINVRRRCFFPSTTGINYITLSGFTIDKAATTWAPPAAFQDGMVGPHWSKGWIIEDCEIWGSRCAGISLGKYKDPANDHYFTYKHVKSPTQMERDAVCRGQYHGWLKENVGHHTVRRCNIHHCEQDGIVGRQGCVFSLIEDNHIHHINNMQELAGAEIAGIKLHAAIDVVMRRNHIHHCTMGIWCDWQAQGTRLTQNLLHDNHAPEPGWPKLAGAMVSQDIFVEVSHGPTLIDNNILLSRSALRMATQGIAFVHNLVAGSLTCVGEGTDNTVNGKNEPRYTPYHFPHRTEVAGFMKILHGDDRFYNNIFVQKYALNNPDENGDNTKSGTFVFDGYPTYDEWYAPFKELEGKPAQEFDMQKLESAHFAHLPVWANGNVYLAGAQAWKKETSNFVNADAGVELSLQENADGSMVLKTNVYDIIGGFTSGIITMQTLGRAFEPEQAYENPDGTPIIFDEDYFGNHRGVYAVPGPFAAADSVQTL